MSEIALNRYKQEIYSSIDFSKFVAALLVVAIHTHPFSGMDADYYFTSLCRIAVPFFFVTTSFFFFRKANPNIKAYTKRLLILYGLWFIIELPLVYHRLFVNFDHSLIVQILNCIRCVLLSNTWGASWFIMACVISVNIVYFLSKKIDNYKLLIVGVLFYVMSLIGSSYSGIIDTFLPIQLVKWHHLLSMAFVPANSFIVAILYIVIGKIIAEGGGVSLNKNVIIFSVTIVAMLGALEVVLVRWSAEITDAFLFLPLLTFWMMLLLLKTEVVIRKDLSKLFRNMSILIYILHAFLVDVNFIFKWYNYGLFFTFFTLFVSILVSIIIIQLSGKITIFKKLY